MGRKTPFMDGHWLTSDVKFTWEAIVNPKNLVKSKSGYDLIQSVETPDEHTAVVKYKEFFAPFLTRFAPVLPKHILGKFENINDAPYNRMPVGTGPFMVTEWASGNYIAMAKNPNAIVDKLLFGKAQAGASEIAHGWASNPDLKPVAYDPEKAKKLLDDAGWKAGPDGIRQKDGKKLRLKITTTNEPGGAIGLGRRPPPHG